MKKVISILVFGILLGCTAKPTKLTIHRMKMNIEIVPEDADSYTISWNDTLCSGEFKDSLFFIKGARYDFLEVRPYELRCFIFNTKNDTLGYYHGLSSPRQWTWFSPTNMRDSTISLRFSVAINHFSAFLAEQSREYIEFNKNNEDRIIFKPVTVNIKDALRKPLSIELVNKNDP